MALYTAPLIEAPEPRGQRYGLFAAANGPLELTGKAIGGGIRYESLGCGVAHSFPVECDDTPPSKEFDADDGVIEADPFMVYAGLVCGPVGSNRARVEAKVRRRLANGEQAAAEAGLAAALAASSPTALLAPYPDDLKSVVGALEQWLYGQAGYGQVGYIHAPLRFAAYAADAGLAVREAGTGVLRTILGTIWIFGDYPDDGTMYATGQVTVWRSEINVPDVDQTLDRQTNQRYVLAERTYAVAWDCVAGEITFDPDLVPS